MRLGDGIFLFIHLLQLFWTTQVASGKSGFKSLPYKHVIFPVGNGVNG